MARRRPGDKPLSQPMTVELPTRICVTLPQKFRLNPNSYAHCFYKKQIWWVLSSEAPILLIFSYKLTIFAHLGYLLVPSSLKILRRCGVTVQNCNFISTRRKISPLFYHIRRPNKHESLIPRYRSLKSVVDARRVVVPHEISSANLYSPFAHWIHRLSC